MRRQFGWMMALMAIVLAAWSCGPSDAVRAERGRSIQDIVARGELRVGYLPWGPLTQEDGTQMRGVYADMMEEIGRALDVRVTYVRSNLANFVPGLEADQFDVFIGPVFVTIPRSTAVAFTNPIVWCGNSGAVRATGDFHPTSVEDLRRPGLRIATSQGQAMEEYGKRHFPQAEFIVVSGSDLSAPFAAVAAGRADIALSNTVTVMEYVAEHPEMKHVLAGDQQMEVLPIAWAVRYRDRDLHTFLNATIEVMHSTGRIREFMERYEPRVIVDPYPLVDMGVTTR